MRILSSIAFRAVAGTATVAALVLGLASMTGHGAPQPAPDSFKLASLSFVKCPICG